MIAPFVDPAWLATHPEAVLLDARAPVDGRSSRLEYLRGHLPGAGFVDLDTDLAAAPSAALGRHPLPDPEVFAAAMRRVGVSDEDTVVAYDTEDGAYAARLVWMLRVTGHDAALLDGRPTGPLSTELPDRPEGRFTASPWPTADVVGIDELGDLVVDARAGERYRGEVEPIDSRPGRIPGAVSLPCRENVGVDGRLLPEPQLRERFAAVDRPWVSSCGSGVTACLNLLVAERLGLPAGRLFVGSYSQWAATDRPVDIGSA